MSDRSTIEQWNTVMKRLETDVEEQPFPTAEFESRLAAVQSELAERGLDALVITTPENIYYLTGYDATVRSEGWFQALVVPAEGDPRFVVPAFESPNVTIGSWLDDLRAYDISTAGGAAADAGTTALRAVMAEAGLEEKTIGFEEDSLFLTVEHYRKITSAFPAEFVDCKGVVEKERRVKSDAEIEYIREAATIVSEATRSGIDAISEETNENEVAAAVSESLIRNGSGHVATQPYVVSGTRSALPHARWRRRTIGGGDIVYFEVGAAVNRYHGSVLRTAYLGEPPDPVAEVDDLVVDALEAAIDRIEPGVPASDVDRACRQLIEEAGYGANFVHMTGYSLGIAFKPGWGEGNLVTLGPNDDTELERNMTFHMPVIVFLPEHGAIGCSETVRVTSDGAETLTDIDRRMFRR